MAEAAQPGAVLPELEVAKRDCSKHSMAMSVRQSAQVLHSWAPGGFLPAQSIPAAETVCESVRPLSLKRLCRRFAHRRNDHGFTHCTSLSAMSRVPSSYSRMASSIRSVAERSTVRCVDAVPYVNL